MGGAMAQRGGLRALGRWAAVAGIAYAASACASVQNIMPSWSEFHLPDTKTFVPTQMSAYSRPITPTTAVGPADLVDGQGLCAGVASAVGPDGAPVAVVPRGVVLEMTECEAARALGQPQQAEINMEPTGARTAVLTYTVGERAGIYRFVNGRLSSIDRGAEPPPPVVAKKPAPRKPKPPPAPPA
jgi:hypothetical protein